MCLSPSTAKLWSLLSALTMFIVLLSRWLAPRLRHDWPTEVASTASHVESSEEEASSSSDKKSTEHQFECSPSSHCQRQLNKIEIAKEEEAVCSFYEKGKEERIEADGQEECEKELSLLDDIGEDLPDSVSIEEREQISLATAETSSTLSEKAGNFEKTSKEEHHVFPWIEIEKNENAPQESPVPIGIDGENEKLSRPSTSSARNEGDEDRNDVSPNGVARAESSTISGEDSFEDLTEEDSNTQDIQEEEFESGKSEPSQSSAENGVFGEVVRPKVATSRLIHFEFMSDFQLRLVKRVCVQHEVSVPTHSLALTDESKWRD